MRQFTFLGLIILAGLTSLSSCKKNEDPKLIFKFYFNPSQVRLNNLGEVATIPSGNAGQSPKMNLMSAHYLELSSSANTQIGEGTVLFKANETNLGGSTAIDFSKSTFAGHQEEFYSVSIKDLIPGEYSYLRVSLAYQNYDIKMHWDTNFVVNGTNYPVDDEYDCTLASFVGYNSYIDSYKIKNQTITVGANKKQGYWGFEGSATIYGQTYNFLQSGQAPEGATTVVNPIASTSPIPAGSCLVTGAFQGGKLKITGKEKDDVIVKVSLSTNKSFEWTDSNGNGKWDPTKGEKIVDMGLRGMIPIIED